MRSVLLFSGGFLRSFDCRLETKEKLILLQIMKAVCNPAKWVVFVTRVGAA